MARTSVRRPVPAIVFILALSLLTALVWVRVLHRGDGAGATKTSSSPVCTTTTAPLVLPKPTQVRVTVLNATQTSGLAFRIATQLHARGFVAGRGNDPTPHDGINQVKYGPKGASSARLVQIYLPGSQLVPTASITTTVVTVSLGVPTTTLATAAAVSSAEKSPARTVRTCK